MSSDWAPAIAISIIALSVSASFVLRGPVGRALAQWIAGWSHNEARWIETKARVAGPGSGEIDQLRDEMEALRSQLAEVQERLDFTERLLTKQRDVERLAPPR